MQPSPRQGPSHHDHLPATGPAVEDHGRVVTANLRAAAAADLAALTCTLREHLASVGCDPLAIRITVHITGRLQPPSGPGDDFEDLAGQLPGCHAPHGPVPP